MCYLLCSKASGGTFIKYVLVYNKIYELHNIYLLRNEIQPREDLKREYLFIL